MKPGTKFQKQVSEASQKLPSISRAQIRWAYRNSISHYGYRTKKGVITCPECSCSRMDGKSKKYCIYPRCNTKLTVVDTGKKVFGDCQYCCIITTCGDFQVLRFLHVIYYAKAGRKAVYFHSEVAQHWIAPDGRNEVVAGLQTSLCYGNYRAPLSRLEIRPVRNYHNIVPFCVYPRRRLIPELKRSGFTGNFHRLAPFDLFHALLSENRAETLLKTGQTELLRFFTLRGFNNIGNYWASIRICIRNAYRISDPSLWCDYMDLLRFFRKDLHSAVYVCPADLKTAHDRYVLKKRMWQNRQSSEKAKQKAMADSKRFMEMKSRFFGIEFTDGLIQVRVLETVEEILREGDMHRHCLFTNEYRLKPDSLLLSASIGEKRIETVEVSLSRLEILQSRGAYNRITEYHDRIIRLVMKNMFLIQKRLAA